MKLNLWLLALGGAAYWYLTKKDKPVVTAAPPNPVTTNTPQYNETASFPTKMVPDTDEDADILND